MKITQPNWDEITKRADLSALLRYMKSKRYTTTLDLLSVIERAKETLGGDFTLSMLIKTIKNHEMEFEIISPTITTTFMNNIKEL